MKISRYLFTGIFLAALTVTIFWLSNEQQHYYPAMTVNLPNNEGKLTFVERPWRDEKDCDESIRKMQTALSATCTGCQITAICTTSPDSGWVAALSNQAMGSHVVQSGTLRILIDTPAASATCQAMARQISQMGKTTGRCMPPQ
ncbi:MAG: hypothetical protein PHW66_00760 [Gallionella sp.]|jgi:hypothetical protein|nr:hypothetical protein [Gallionella sp.]